MSARAARRPERDSAPGCPFQVGHAYLVKQSFGCLYNLRETVVEVGDVVVFQESFEVPREGLEFHFLGGVWTPRDREHIAQWREVFEEIPSKNLATYAPDYASLHDSRLFVERKQHKAALETDLSSACDRLGRSDAASTVRLRFRLGVKAEEYVMLCKRYDFPADRELLKRIVAADPSLRGTLRL